MLILIKKYTQFINKLLISVQMLLYNMYSVDNVIIYVRGT